MEAVLMSYLQNNYVMNPSHNDVAMILRLWAMMNNYNNNNRYEVIMMYIKVMLWIWNKNDGTCKICW